MRCFFSTYDIELNSENILGNKVVVPDISVICDKKGFQENKYVGVPKLIIEIVSPSNQSNDLVIKLNLYMNYGVNEYWIANPILNTIQVYILNSKGLYDQVTVIRDKGNVTSQCIPGFTVELEELFKG